jgi:hypothetical protein
MSGFSFRQGHGVEAREQAGIGDDANLIEPISLQSGDEPAALFRLN